MRHRDGGLVGRVARQGNRCRHKPASSFERPAHECGNVSSVFDQRCALANQLVAAVA
jgi:hypothetical protein